MDDELIPVPRPAVEQKAISVGELRQMCVAAANKLNRNNKNKKLRNLLMNCQYALGQLTDRLAKYEGGVQ